MMAHKWDSDEEVQRLREYLKIPSVHPNIDYSECVKFLKKQADALGLRARVYEMVKQKPLVVITWEGVFPTLSSILLNSHMDVVPVHEEHWTYPPFEAQISKDGYIYARGIQDMKSVGMMHLEAVRRLKSAGARLERTVHISFSSEEEIGGTDGMKIFSESEEFKALNIGFGLDESVASQHRNAIIAFNGERTSKSLTVTCKGNPGHGSLMPADTAGEKLFYVLRKFMELRAQEKKKLDEGKPLGEVISVNLTMIEGGDQLNVLPESLSASFDMRIPPKEDHDQIDNMIKSWCAEAGEGVTFEYAVKNPVVPIVDIEDNPYWSSMNKALKKMGINVVLTVCPGATDARFIRLRKIPVIGLSPLLNTQVLLHAHDERLHVDEYKRGIDIMEKVVEAVANS